MSARDHFNPSLSRGALTRLAMVWLPALVSGPGLAQPQIDALPQPVTRPALDLEAIAQGYAALTPSLEPIAPRPPEPALLIFVSFALPDTTLQRLANQAERAHASLILRGLVDGSLMQTVARVQRVTAGHTPSFQIDPQAFDRFAIRRTPTFVLLRAAEQTRESQRACAGQQCPSAATHVKVAGDVSLDYALEAIQRKAPRFSGEAQHFMQRLRSQR